MKRSFLDIAACPECLSPLELSVFVEKQFRLEEVIEGLLHCTRCVKTFPIIDGIPRFVPNADAQFPEFFMKYADALKPGGRMKTVQDEGGARTEAFVKDHGSTQERFGFEWLNYPGSMPEDKEVFLAETQIAPEEWKGKRVMDAGCGMGRYAQVAHELGATVVALDLSVAVRRLWETARESERMHLVQGDLSSPPLRNGIFDIVYSIGVIHHTPSAKATFKKLSALVRKQGNLTLWVYGRAGRFSGFKTNPLKSGRGGLKKFIFLVWTIVGVREFLSDALRLFTVYLPHKLLYGLCYPLALIGKVPFLKYLTFSVHPLWRVRLQENFDWLAPPYQSHHTKEELSEWFKETGFEILKILPHGFVPKPGILGRKN